MASNVAAQLNTADWEYVLGQCSASTQADLVKRLSEMSGKADEDLEGVMADPKQQFAMMMEMMVDMQTKLRSTMNEIEVLKAKHEEEKSRGGVGGRGAGKGGKKKRAQGTVNKKTTAELAGSSGSRRQLIRAPSVEVGRKGSYRFGSGKINYIKPRKGYPTAAEAKEKPPGQLVLEYAHGYQGKESYGRDNIFYATDPTSDAAALIYHVAGVGIVSNMKDRSQKFFLEHNDDITCIALSGHAARPTLVATGQTDPKDIGEKDMPKIYIWDWLTMKTVKLVPDAHWGMVLKLQFSVKNDYLYSIGGEEEHLFKIWDLKNLSRSGKAGMLKEKLSTPTVKDDIFGFLVNPYKCNEKYIEEFIIFGRKKAAWCGLQKDKKGFSMKMKNVPFTIIKEVKADKKLLPKAILCAEWLPNGKFILGDNVGAMFICEQSNPIARIVAHPKMLGAILLTPDGEIVTAANDGHIKKWAINSQCTNMKENFKTIKTIEFDDNDFEFLPRAMAYDSSSKNLFVGSKTCQICTFNIGDRSSSILVDGHDDQVWGLTTCNKEGYEHYYVTGGFDGVLKMWDSKLRKLVDTYEFDVDGDQKKQIVQCIWSNDGMLVAAGSEDGWVYLFTWFDNPRRELVLVAEFECPVKKGREPEGVSYMRFSEDDAILAVAHMDANLYLFNISKSGGAAGGGDEKQSDVGSYKLDMWKPATHRAAPTHIQWNKDATMIKVLTRDYEVAHWKLDRGSRKLSFYPHIPDPDDVEWAGDPLVAGWDVEGCYQAEWDGTDLNDVTLSDDGIFLAAGDDFGAVRLYKYPAVSNKPEAHRKYLGHSSFVVGVEFCRNNEYLITCGGNDMAIFQWRLEKF